MDKKVDSQVQLQEIEDAIQSQESLLGSGILPDEQIQAPSRVCVKNNPHCRLR